MFYGIRGGKKSFRQTISGAPRNNEKGGGTNVREILRHPKNVPRGLGVNFSSR